MKVDEKLLHWDAEKEKILMRRNPKKRWVIEHDHSFLELTYILSGSVKHTLNGSVTQLSPGDYLIVDHGSIHSYESLSEEGFSNLDCIFRPELLDRSLKGFSTLRSVLEHYLLHFNTQAFLENPARIVFHDETGRILEILTCMEAEFSKKEAGYPELLRCYLIEILILTIRKLEDAEALATGQDISAFLTAYVAEHYMEEKLTLCDLAARLRYSLPYVSKRFKDDTGVNFVRYLQNYRVTQGCRLLISSDHTIPEIAEMVGYRDVKFFSELVKRETGLSPSEYRKRRKIPPQSR
jgi:AraC-like DNA-binding protein